MAAAGTEDLVQLLLVEAGQVGQLAARVLAIDLDQAGDEELLLLVRLGMPEVGLAQGDEEARVAGPLAVVGADEGAGEGLDVGEVVEVPRLADGKGAAGVLLGLVHAHAAGAADGDDDDTRLLRFGGPGVRRGRRRGMGGILGDSDVGDVGLEDWAVGRGGPASASAGVAGCRGGAYAREPSSSFLLKQLSMMRRFSSSKRSAREAAAAPLARSIGEPSSRTGRVRRAWADAAGSWPGLGRGGNGGTASTVGDGAGRVVRRRSAKRCESRVCPSG